MISNIKGIVIRIRDYKDNDQLLDVLTSEYGVISLIARGTKKPKAKLHYLISSLYEFSFDYKENHTMFMIINSGLIKSYIAYDDALMNAFVSIFYEIIVKFKDFLNSETYDNLEFLLNNLSHSNYLLLGSIFISYIMKMNGIIPYVDGCVVCNKKKVVSISSDLGGFVCEEHSQGNPNLDVELLKDFRIICKATYKDYEAIKDYKISEILFDTLCQFFMYNSDVKLKSYEFYTRVI